MNRFLFSSYPHSTYLQKHKTGPCRTRLSSSSQSSYRGRRACLFQLNHAEMHGQSVAVVVFHIGRIRRRQTAEKPSSPWPYDEKTEQYGGQVGMQPNAAADESELKGGRNYNAPS